KFSTNEASKFKCMCGASNCRGTLAAKMPEEEVDVSKLKGNARKELLKKRGRQLRKQLSKVVHDQKVTLRRLSLTGRLLPGDRTAEVKGGPPVKYFPFARV
ncbi:unnamed protein product, partial [Choristocarpus tenellus]